jgi:hypothetical protein
MAAGLPAPHKAGSRQPGSRKPSSRENAE